jgi:hypothetical protein
MVAIKPSVHQALAVGIDRAEDAGENLEGDSLSVHLNPEAARAEARHCYPT